MSDVQDENQELCVDFVTESREMIGEVEPVLVELETEASSSGEIDTSQVDAIFRAFHSMKGSGGFLDLNNLVAVTHQAESLLDLFRKGEASLEPQHITVLCKAMDFILELLDQIENEFHDEGREDDAQALVAEIRAEMETPSFEADEEAARPEAEAEPSQEVGVEDELEITDDLVLSFIQDAQEQLESAETALLELDQGDSGIEQISVAFRSLHSLKGNCGFFGYAEMERTAHGMETILDAARDSGVAPESEVISQLLQQVDVLRVAANGLHPDGAAPAVSPPATPSAAPPEPAVSTEKPADPPASPAPKEAAPAVRDADAAQTAGQPKQKEKRKTSAGNIRVDLEKLDSLMDLVGELILAETMVTHNPDLEGHHFEDFQKASLQLNRITRALQDVAMGVRMVPIAGTFRKMLRLVRDLARKQGKQVDLQLVGEDTEIDKTVVEAIADPLVHIIRNSVDHGIEGQEDRAAAGKDATGRIRLEAKHQGGEIWISIEDDGKGLNRDAILEKARAKGLIDPARGELSDSEIFRFIFDAGFSTAAKVTDVSGRGVGMDVVRRNIDKLKGRVDVSSTQGQGSTITIRLPLTLAIVEGMLVGVGGSVYTIPLLAIQESVSPKNEDVTKLSDGQEMANIRGKLLPVLRIHELHGVADAEQELGKGTLVVVEEHGSSFAIFVDELIGQRQTVIKALPDYLGSVPGVSGCSILSNGDISMILDVKALQGEWLAGGKA
ncbi:MAG: chemotaxis protein CheA [bacterium]|nr:chemotaxis protein CheA [bacterium]